MWFSTLHENLDTKQLCSKWPRVYENASKMFVKHKNKALIESSSKELPMKRARKCNSVLVTFSIPTDLPFEKKRTQAQRSWNLDTLYCLIDMDDFFQLWKNYLTIIHSMKIKILIAIWVTSKKLIFVAFENRSVVNLSCSAGMFFDRLRPFSITSLKPLHQFLRLGESIETDRRKDLHTWKESTFDADQELIVPLKLPSACRKWFGKISVSPFLSDGYKNVLIQSS